MRTVTWLLVLVGMTGCGDGSYLLPQQGGDAGEGEQVSVQPEEPGSLPHVGQGCYLEARERVEQCAGEFALAGFFCADVNLTTDLNDGGCACHCRGELIGADGGR